MNDRKKSAARLPYGMTRADGRFEARYWLADVKKAAIRLEDGREFELTPSSEGLWCAQLDVRPGERYRLRVDGALVPDPYARFLPDGAEGPAEVVDLTEVAPTEGPVSRPIHEVVILEVHVGTATPEGTFRALMRELPRYRDVGITAVELLPLNQFGGEFGWGYDGVFFFAPHHAYGSPADLAALVDEAHRLGLMVFNDVVYNHLGPISNPWPAAAPGFMREDSATPWGPTLDFRKLHVREIVIANVLEWLEVFRFDGLRFDAVHTIVDDTDRDILDDIAAAIRQGPGAER
ncbi:MAG: alpha-amylase family glycosyl hydrolase, partial [Myxococcota bacterium]